MLKNFKKSNGKISIYSRWANNRASFRWYKKLLVILNRIVDNGDTVIVIEHNLDVIKVADYIIDLGPDGGKYGGEIVATGTPEEVAKTKGSYTGEFLAKILK